jgi:hypothetical protein
MRIAETINELNRQIANLDKQIRDLEYRKRNTIEIRERLLAYLRDEE